MSKETESIGFTQFRYSKENVDEIFSLLLQNGNSISDTVRFYRHYPYQSKMDRHDVVALIEQCADAIRGGLKTSDEYWEKLMERLSGNGHCITCTKV